MKFSFPHQALLALLCSLAFLGSCSGEYQSQSIDDYEQARNVFWRVVYPKSGKTLYCGQDFQTRDRQGINIEHVFPMSWVTHALKCGKRKQCRATSATFNRIEADLHNLFPARSDVNYARSSHRFGEIAGERREFGAECDFELDKRARMVEPREEVRGDIARAMFYMESRYSDHGLEIFAKQKALLKKWHAFDPPSEIEKQRNDRIEQAQGNRNPFIDDPNRPVL